jgi:branched-chain amino acid aminotransferase
MSRPMFLSRRLTAALSTPASSRLPCSLVQNARHYSIKPEAASATEQLDIDPRKLVITKTSQPRALTKPEELIFGQKFTGTGCPNLHSVYARCQRLD